MRRSPLPFFLLLRAPSVPVLFVVAGALSGCGAASHGDDPADPPGGAATGLEACVLGGGHLVEVDSVENDDVTDHGDLVAFAASSSDVLAAAGADGTVKLWSLDEGLLGVVDSSALLYGAEIPAAP